MKNTFNTFGLFSLLFAMCIVNTEGANPSGNLRIELIAGYNFVVRSNIESQPGTSPYSAYLAAKFCNDGTTPLTNVYAYIGNFDGGNNPTPGIYPLSNPADHPNLTGPEAGGAFSLTHEGGLLGTTDASRYIGTIEPGECVAVYWLVSYPLTDVNGKATHGPSVKDFDDLSLVFDVWGSAYESGSEYVADTSRRVYMRNMLQAMANKIQPNTANKVPQEYLDLLAIYAPTWTNSVNDGSPGTSFLTEGYWYDLGNINQGFDNDGDLVPDYNAWLQPVGDPSLFDPSCFRLVGTKTLIVIKRSAGNPDYVIVAEDELYFTNLPVDNRGGIGLVIYEFMPLCSGCTSQLTPYQAVASGRDNEKFNGDYGATLGEGLFSTPSSVTIDKVVDQLLSGSASNLSYTITFTNTGIVAVGQPDQGMPLVVSDSIPFGATYVAGSAAANNVLPAGVTEYTIFYSTNNAATWSVTEPTPASNVTDIQWWLSDPLQTNTHGAVTFDVLTDDPAPPLIHNVAGLSFGNTIPFVEDDAITLIAGPNEISGTVFADIGTDDGIFGNGILDGGELGISNITVTLYFDVNGDGVLDPGDVLFATTVSDADGFYSFTDLPNGDFIIVVDVNDPDLPLGYSQTSPIQIPVTLNDADSTGNNFGFAPGLTLTKTGPTYVDRGGEVIYTIGVSNNLPPTTETVTYTAYATNTVAAFTITQGNPGTWVNPQNALNAPDEVFATKLYNNQDQNLGVGGFTVAPSSASITNVRVVVKYSATSDRDTWRANDGFYIRVYTNAALTATPIASSEKYLPLSMHGGTGVGSGVITNNITLSNSWNWAYFNPANSNLFVAIVAERQGGGRRAVALGIDSIGFIVTTDLSTTTLNPVPLYDYYDTNILQFVSAVPPVTTSDAGGPAPNTGRLFWTNVGPIASSTSTNIIVTFNAIGPAGNMGTITTNTAVITNATFVTGVSANEGFAEAPTEIPSVGAIGDTIFWDANRNGQQDAAELGVPGVLVELYSNATLVASQYTDADGVYLFTNLLPGAYTVVVVQDDGDPDYPLLGAELMADPDADGVPCWSPFAIGCDNVHIVNLLPGQTYLGADFGYDPPGGTIGGTLWIDFDGDDQIDPGETRLAFIPVILYESGVPIATNLTDIDGFYQFYGLPDGNYSTRVVTDDVDFPFPSGLTQTYDRDGFIDNIATNILVSGGSVISVNSVPCTSCDLNNNFGYRYTGNNSLSGTVGMDNPLDIDGVLNGTNTTGVGAGEVAFSGVAVYAYLWHDLNDDGIVDPGETIMVGVTTTTANGDYIFTDLPDGFDANPYYIVSIAAPMTSLALTTDETSAPNPSFLVVNNQNLQGHTVSAYQAVEIEPVITNVDFAFVSLLDYDFGDLPNSYSTLLTGGARHVVKETPDLYLGAGVSTEPNGQPSVGADADDFDDGVEVVGIWQNGTNGATVQVTVGAGSGWLVAFMDFNKSGAFDTANELIISTAVSDSGGPNSDGVYEFTFNVPAGSLSTTNTTFLYSRFRLFPSQPLFPVLAYQGEATNGEVEDYRWAFNAISGTVYWDADEDTLFSGGDEPQAGVIVYLYDADTNLVASTVTQLDGSYSFYGLPNGDYQIVMDTPDGANAILDVDGPGNGYDTIDVTLNNSSAVNQDFLLDDQPLVGNISGTVWEDDGFDNPGNGVFDGSDMPVPGVLITLYRDINGDGTIDLNEFVASTVTDLDGFYEFLNIPDGDYIISMTTPNGADSIDDVDGDTNGTDLIQVTIENGEDVEDQDFLIDGASAVAELSGLIWFDASRNDIRESNEANRFAGVTVDLLDASSNVVATTTSLADGTYAFTNVVPGTYIVRFDLTDLIEDYGVADAFAGVDTTRDSDATSVVGVYAFTDPFILYASQSMEHVDLGLQIPVPTRASIADVWGEWTGQAEVVWQAEYEFNTAAYRVYRVDPAGSETLLAEAAADPFAEEPIYRVVDPQALAGAWGTYRLEEIETNERIIDLGEYEIQFGKPRPVKVARATRALSNEESIQFVKSAFSGPSISDCLKVEVEREGLYAVTLQSIADGMGLALEDVKGLADAGGLGMSSEGQPVAYRYDSDGERLIFFGRPTSNWYGEHGVYWIRPEAALWMDERLSGTTSGVDHAPATVRYSEKRQPSLFPHQIPASYYYWDFFINNMTKSFAIDLPAYHSGAVTLRVTLSGWNISTIKPTHRAEIEFNGTLVNVASFSDQDSITATVTVPGDLVQPGQNTVTIRGTLANGVASSWFVLNSIEADYTRALEPTSQTAVVQANGSEAYSAAGYQSPVVVAKSVDGALAWIQNQGGWLTDSAWLADESDAIYAISESDAISALTPVPGVCTAWFMDADNRIDYLVITTRALESAAQQLADYRAGQGLRVGVALFEEVVDLFGHGVRTPDAIRDLLRYAHAEWVDAPWMVLLAGSGHYDYLNKTTALVNHIPSMMSASPDGLFASDVRIADLFGNNGRPDVAIGRLPARTAADLQIMVNKIIAYEAQYGEAWHNTVVLAADRLDPNAGDFEASSEVLAAAAEGASIARIYRGQTTRAAARTALFGHFNDGAGIIHYTGHGTAVSLHGDNLLVAADVNGLNNARRPVMIALTCLAGRFDDPAATRVSLAELLLRRNNGGAVAMWSSSGLSYNAPATLLGEAFYEELYDDQVSTLGVAIQRAHHKVEEDAIYGSTYAMYNLLGDPAMKLGDIAGNGWDRDGFAQWRWEQFAPAELADASISSADADANGNGLNNFVEYALGETVLVPVESLPPSGYATTSSGGDVGETVLVRWNQRKLGRDVAYRISISTDLQNWQVDPPGLQVVSTQPVPNSVLEQVTARLPFTGGRLYVKLDVIDKR